MQLFEIASILITLAALFSFANYAWLRLPTTIGIMLLALASSLLLIAFGDAADGLRAAAGRLVASVDFNEAVLHGMLALLLFAGSLHLNLADLLAEWDAVATLALVGTAVSTAVVAGLTWLVFDLLGTPLSSIYCLLFGALISPTDPIAVLGIMRSVGAPKAVETQVTGESLFNDGIGVVIFLTALGVVTGGHTPTPGGVALTLLIEVVGGVGVGLAAGLLVYQLLKRVDDYQVEVLLTLALATGGFALAEALHVSAPIAVVVAGLFIGNRGRAFAMSAVTQERLDTFWELVDGILNAVLFLLIGLEVFVAVLSPRYLGVAAAAVAIALVARAASVGGALAFLRLRRRFARGSARVLIWAGLRGGLSVAMALSLPPGETRNLILTVTYAVVVFSIFAQGLTIAPLVRRLMPRTAA